MAKRKTDRTSHTPNPKTPPLDCPLRVALTDSTLANKVKGWRPRRIDLLEDTVPETLARLWKIHCDGNYKLARGSITQAAAGVLRNVRSELARASTKRRAAAEEFCSETADCQDALDGLIHEEQRSALARAMNQLSDEDRELIRRRFGYDSTSVADGAMTATERSRLRRALKYLRTILLSWNL